MGMFDDILENVGEPFSGGKGFEYGTHEVVIGEVAAVTKKVKSNPTAAIIEVTVFDENDKDRTAVCTLYFHTEGGAKMSVAKVLGLLVHKVSEDKKDAVRDLGRKLFGGITDPTKARDVAAKLMNDKLVGAKAFLVAEPSGKYKTTSYGDIWHYAAEPESKPVDVVATVGGEDITNTAEGEDLPDFGEL